MTVFKAFLKILNKNKFIVILYSCLLLTFGGTYINSSDTNINFSAKKPNITIVNYDIEEGITKDLIKYIKKNSKTPKIEDNEEKRSDALFYEDTNYIIYIPKNFNKDFMEGLNPEIKIKKSNNYNAYYADRILKRYLKLINIYRKSFTSEEEIIEKVNDTLSKKADVKILSKLDNSKLEKAVFYYNFESYSILACLIYVICLIMSTFNSSKIRKRIVISSMDYKKNNRILLLSNCLYSFVIWLFYLIMSFIFVGNIMFTKHGIILVINSLLFTICATTIAFFIGTVVNNKNAISGIVNVVALGSSFLCGAFVPSYMLPDFVLKIAHILPTYYYINTNESLKTLEIFSFEKLKPIIFNSIIIILFTIVFIILSNLFTKRKRKLA